MGAGDAVEAARLTERAAHVLLVRPDIEDSNGEERPTLRRPEETRTHLVELRILESLEARESLSGHVLVFREEVDQRHATPCVDADLHELPGLIADVWEILRNGMVGSRPADEQALQVDDVGDSVADRPAGTAGADECSSIIEVLGHRRHVRKDFRVGLPEALGRRDVSTVHRHPA